MQTFQDWVQEIVDNINGIVQEVHVDDNDTLTITVECPEKLQHEKV